VKLSFFRANFPELTARQRARVDAEMEKTMLNFMGSPQVKNITPCVHNTAQVSLQSSVAATCDKGTEHFFPKELPRFSHH